MNINFEINLYKKIISLLININLKTESRKNRDKLFYVLTALEA